jgi:transposase-like protein
VSARRKYEDAIYEAAIHRYQLGKESVLGIAESLEVNYHTLCQWIDRFRRGHARKPSQSIER